MQERRKTLLERLETVPDENLYTYSTGEVRNYGAFLGYDFTARLGKLRIPVLFVHGTADATVPFSYSETMRYGIAGAVLCPVPGADHGITEYPEAQAAISEWLQRMAIELTAGG